MVPSPGTLSCYMVPSPNVDNNVINNTSILHNDHSINVNSQELFSSDISVGNLDFNQFDSNYSPFTNDQIVNSQDSLDQNVEFFPPQNLAQNVHMSSLNNSNSQTSPRRSSRLTTKKRVDYKSLHFGRS